MKKVLSIALAIVMVLSVSVVAFADDEYLWDEPTMFWSSGSWSPYTLENGTITEFIEALQTEGAVLVITKDTETDIAYEDGGSYEKFAVQDSWWQGVDVSTGNSFVFLGTKGHTSEMEPDSGIIDCIYDDGTVVMWDGAEVAEALEAGGFNNGASVLLTSNTSEEGAYKITNVAIVVPETTEEETTDEAEASEETTEEASESTETSTASSPDTGVALALVPMAIAGFAVVSSKRR